MSWPAPCSVKIRPGSAPSTGSCCMPPVPKELAQPGCPTSWAWSRAASLPARPGGTRRFRARSGPARPDQPGQWHRRVVGAGDRADPLGGGPGRPARIRPPGTGQLREHVCLLRAAARIVRRHPDAPGRAYQAVEGQHTQRAPRSPQRPGCLSGARCGLRYWHARSQRGTAYSCCPLLGRRYKGRSARQAVLREAAAAGDDSPAGRRPGSRSQVP